MHKTDTTSMDSIDNETLHSHFLFQKLTPCNGKPKYASMQKIEQQANQNALTIFSPYGDGQKGHLGLTMQDNLYFAWYSYHFIISNDPSPYPDVPASTMAAHQAEL